MVVKLFGRILVASAVAIVVLQFVHPTIPARPATAELQAPPEVRHILEKDCYSCHSDQRRLAWFDQIEPGYWLVRKDILAARRRLDFDTLGSKPAAAQKATLYEAVNSIQLGAMPLPRFVALHPDAKVTPQELATLKAYLAPWTPAPARPASAPAGGNAKAGSSPVAIHAETLPVSLPAVQPEQNGLSFDPTFESWKPLSTTDRGDNNTFRFVLGNDVAIKAAQSGNISPWPDGTRFAKVTWQQEPGPDGLVHPGKFVQVELMVKDAQRYKDTDGWGWGRWRGLELKPFGQDAKFVNECTGCHAPVRGNDYVYTLPMTHAQLDKEEIVNNDAAALPASLPWQPLGWNAITLYVDPRTRATATLYGNDAAMQAIHARGYPATLEAPSYQAGAVLALVTWAQRNDPHWFGARIPDKPQHVEFVQVGSDAGKNTYRSFSHSGMMEDHLEAGKAAQRVKFVLSLAPAPLP
jgi:hypothetical protein